MMQRDDVTVRMAVLKDVIRLAELDRSIFSDYWSEKAFISSVDSKMEIVTVAVLRDTEEIAAYAAVSYVLDECNINRIAVAPEFRGRGLGTYLLGCIEELLSPDVTIFNLEVRESNKYAIEMYEKFGYTVLGRRKNFYRCPTEDALLMTKRKV
ncbi:ribosomal protein S18-alanine N-acetyltransferase [Ruminococcus sp. HUN007]|uniref:ribosomal protein S18-alanine N-acetyltransferase n=1 Tax=Ruminococcus sp. HUN007 TaxID=1514668 RepID=UPI0005D2A093|nr:ribosomal protein S18-alanine N-acetyltransferase [Ruminococcus sp. HUN007]